MFFQEYVDHIFEKDRDRSFDDTCIEACSQKFRSCEKAPIPEKYWSRGASMISSIVSRSDVPLHVWMISVPMICLTGMA
jgi:hypothetical protein